MKLTYAQSTGIAIADSVTDAIYEYESHDYRIGLAIGIKYYLIRHFGHLECEFLLIGDHTPSKIIKNISGTGKYAIKKKMRKNFENALHALKKSEFLDFTIDQNKEITVKLNHAMFHFV